MFKIIMRNYQPNFFSKNVDLKFVGNKWGEYTYMLRMMLDMQDSLLP